MKCLNSQYAMTLPQESPSRVAEMPDTTEVLGMRQYNPVRSIAVRTHKAPRQYIRTYTWLMIFAYAVMG